jgi:hypothetical protein
MTASAPAAAQPLTALTNHVTEALRKAGPQGALPPFGLRGKAEKAALPDAIAALLHDKTILKMGGAKPRYVLAAAEVAPADALKALNAAKTRGLTLDGLAKKLKVMTTHLEPALAALASTAQAVAMSKAKAKTLTWYATPHRPPTLDDVTAKLAATLRGPALFDEADAKVTLTTRERPLLKQALAFLAADDQIHPFTHTKRKAGGKPGASRTLWGFVGAVALPVAYPAVSPDPSPDPSPAAAPSPAPEGSDSVGAEVRRAYQALRREGGAPFVLIYGLCERSGLPVAQVQAWLLAEARAGRAQLTGSNVATLAPAVAAAAVTWGGEPCALARLQEGGAP